ncbi:hypothetical protein XA26_51210 [Mycolicibacterium fortuitum]|uniref:Mce associated membrane protein n=1 Tax=Mycolicibacterium fortuitum TaxID=1766 RepID=A0A0N9YL73_MYCFO|nr:mce associated protein mas1a [Mycolicibacterium fortuitum]ALI28915.1 hypothetical protein XA26_51210 [Mycolicibacterium fortuitum]
MSRSDDESVDDGGESVLTLEDPTDDTEEAPDALEESEPSGLKRLLVPALVAMVALAATAAIVVLSIGEYQHRQDDALRAEAVATSRDYLIAMAGFDYQKMDANRDHIVSGSTQAFAAKYDEMVKALRDIVVTSKGVATATADRVAVDALDGDTATVIAFVDQHVTNVTAPQGSNQKYRMVVKLVRSGDRWIVDDVQTV